MKLLTVCLAATLIFGCKKEDDKKEDTADGGGSTPLVSAPTLSGTYASNCYPISGAAISTETLYQYRVFFGAGGIANEYEFAKVFASNSSCTTAVYQSLQEGVFTVGSETTTPAGGWQISFTTTGSVLITWGNAATTAVQAGCNSNIMWNSSGPNSFGNVTGNFACASISIRPANTDFFNVFVENGNSIQIGLPIDDPGVLTSGAVPTTVSLTLTK